MQLWFAGGGGYIQTHNRPFLFMILFTFGQGISIRHSNKKLL